jgi:hypothetical protein
VVSNMTTRSFSDFAGVVMEKGPSRFAPFARALWGSW